VYESRGLYTGEVDNQARRGFVQARSLLYVPGDKRNLLDKAFSRGADAVILDLEDAVVPSQKKIAREVMSEWIQSQAARASQIWVRINADSPEEDIAVITAPIAGVMVPRAESALLANVDELLTLREDFLDIARGEIAVIPLIETASGLLSAASLATMPRVVRLAIGRVDLAGELGLGVDPEGPEFRTILLQLVIASSAARISAPLAPTSTDFRDLDALSESTEALMKLGFRGRTAIHPAQLAVINEVFTPTSEEVHRAKSLIAAFEESTRQESGVFVGEDGRMVDAAVMRSARDILSRSRSTE